MKRSPVYTPNGFYEDSHPAKLTKTDDVLEKHFDNLLPSTKDLIIATPDDYSNEILDEDYPKLANQLICAAELSGPFILRAEVYSKDIKIHIRHYALNIYNRSYPTKTGICMDLTTWLRFSQKLYHFNLQYITTSFVANNKLIALNHNGLLFVQRMDTLQSVNLNEDQCEILKHECHDFNVKLLTFIMKTYLPALIASKLPPTTHCEEDDNMLHKRLLTCLESELVSNVFKDFFICQGCVHSQTDQVAHVCMYMNSFEKWKQIGHFCLLAVNFKSVVQRFIENTPAVSASFLQNIHIQLLCSNLFQLPTDIVQ